jgi:lipopolysaccharide transport system permease protein
MSRITIVEATKPPHDTVSEIWEHRELAWRLAWAEISVRYKQSVLGVMWAVFRPVMTMLVFTVIFGRIAKLPPAEGMNYSVMVFAAVLPWQLFSSGMSSCGFCFVAHSNIIKKVYFPRLLLPIGKVLPSVVDFGIGLIIFFLLAVYMAWTPDLRLFAVIFSLSLCILITFGTGLIFAVLNAKYRDIKHLMPFVTQMGLFITPVGYSIDVIPDQYRMIYFLNPMVGVVESFRWAMGSSSIRITELLISAIVTLIICSLGIKLYTKAQSDLTDVL